MIERSYTVKELDALREACDLRWTFGTTNLSVLSGSWSKSYRQEDKDRGIEELVRTCMMAGITAEDIYKEDRSDEESEGVQ